MSTFEDDVFLSYRQHDNLSEGNKGWVAKFHRSLENRLTEVLGSKPRIWRDNRLQGCEYFADEIRDRLAKTKVLVAVVSPGYVKSSWCMNELREFCEQAERHTGLRVGNTSRLIKVVKTFVPRNQHPPQLQGLLGYELYDTTQEDAGGLPREYSQEASGYQHEAYKFKVEQIAWSIKQILELLAADEPFDKERTVYVAQTTSDLQPARDNIIAELEARKFYVLPRPGETFFSNVKDYENVVRENMLRSRLSIHLVGGYYGVIPEGGDISVVDLQNKLGAQLSKGGYLTRLIWLPPNLKTKEKRQADFVEYLRAEPAAQEGGQLFERPLEELKTRIVQIITSTPSKPPDDDLIRIYLMCDEPDSNTVSVVENYLFDKRYEVILPPSDGDGGRVLQLHKDSLLVCDATLIYYGNSNESWYRSKLIDLIKAKVWGRTTPMLCKGVFITDPQTPHKHSLRTLDALPLPPFFKGVPPESLDVSLQPFIEQIEKAKTELSVSGRQ
jgi:TIR domain